MYISGGENVYPADFVALPALPRTESGKVQKHRLAGADAG